MQQHENSLSEGHSTISESHMLKPTSPDNGEITIDGTYPKQATPLSVTSTRHNKMSIERHILYSQKQSTPSPSFGPVESTRKLGDIVLSVQPHGNRQSCTKLPFHLPSDFGLCHVLQKPSRRPCCDRVLQSYSRACNTPLAIQLLTQSSLGCLATSGSQR